MAEPLNAAVEELEKQLQEELQKAGTTKKLINSLLRRMGKPDRYTDTGEIGLGPVRGDMYYGKPLATAAQMVLERIQHATPVQDILKALEEGGFDFRPRNWSEKMRLRNLAISLAKNTKAFHKLPNGTFGLRNWYDEATINASRREREVEAIESLEVEEEPDEEKVIAQQPSGMKTSA